VGVQVIMSINRWIEHSSLGPEEVGRLNLAYETTLRALYLDNREDHIAEIVAKKIIEVGLSGQRDPAQISSRALKELGIP
jgi:hypothetical protein